MNYVLFSMECISSLGPAKDAQNLNSSFTCIIQAVCLSQINFNLNQQLLKHSSGSKLALHRYHTFIFLY